MKQTVKVTAPSHFASFLVAMNIPFFFDFGDFYITNTADPDKFRKYCETHGVRECDLKDMKFETANLEI